MQIVTLQTKDFKGLPNGIYNFTDNNIITGRNGSGKSSIGEAIIFALYGRTRTGNASTGDLIHESAESTMVAVEFDTGTTLLREDSRFYGTKIQLNGEVTDQRTLDSSIPEYKTFISVFMPGYFMAQDESDQRNLLLQYGESIDMAKLFGEYTRKPELLSKYLIDFNNLDKEYKNYRKMDADLKSSVLSNEQRSQYAAEQIASLKKPKAKIDVEKTQAQIDLIEANQAYDYAIATNSELAKRSAAALKGNCPECNQPLSKEAITAKVKQIESGKIEVPPKPGKLPKASLSELREKLSEAKAVNALYDNYEEQVLDLEAQKVEAADKAAKGKEQMADLSMVVEALSPKGIRAQAARRQIKPIIDAINEFTGDSLPIKIETLEQLKTRGDMKEVFKVYANEIPYKFLSSGEKKRVDIAISQTINKLSGAEIDMYFVDDAELISEEFILTGQTYKAYVVPSEPITIKEG